MTLAGIKNTTMKTITLGIFLEPAIWIEDHPQINNNLSPENCTEIVFSHQLKIGVDVFVWRQGLIGAKFSENFIGEKLDIYSLLSGFTKTKIARMPLIFFNAFIYTFYDIKLKGKHNSSWTIKQHTYARDIYYFQEPPTSTSYPDHNNLALPFSQRYSKEIPIYEMGRIQGILKPHNQMMMNSYPTSDIVDTINKLEKILSFRYDMLECLSILNNAVYSLQEGQLSESLFLSWAVAEKCISVLWQDYWRKNPSGPKNKSGITKNGTPIKKIDKKQENVSQRIEFLEFEKYITPQLYNKLIIRKVRNKWTHELQTVTFAEAGDCHTCANELLTHTTGIQLYHPGASPL